MRWSLPLVLSSCALLTSGVPAGAQDAPLPSRRVVLAAPIDALTSAERREVDRWLAQMRKWQQVDRRWHNAVAHDAFGHIVKRMREPQAPAWLDARCAERGQAVTTTLATPLDRACRVLDGLSEDPAANAIRTSTAAARARAERLVRHTFLTRVHIDGLWTTTSTDVRMYGLIGSHISLVDVGRVQFFGPPGVILLSVPDGSGSRQIRAGYTWGMSVRLADVRLFAPSKNLTLFLTATKVWLAGGMSDRLAPAGFDIAGFSLAPRKRR